MQSDQIKNRTILRNHLNGNKFQNLKGKMAKMNWKKILPVFIIVCTVLVVGTLAVNLLKPTVKSEDNRVTVQPAKATMTVKKEFAFPIKDEKGKEVTKLKLFVDTIDLRDEIIVQGQKAYPVQGKTFLVVDTRFRNDFNQPIEIKARDYFRLEVNGNDKDKLAADIHNDPVTIQPLSTKQVRLGFFINDTDKDMVLFVGELTGKKAEVPVKF